MPLSMGLLALQCLAELVRRIAFLRGHALKPELSEHEIPPWSLDDARGTARSR
jgi:TRAP-type mannitol/chloroaromatic compound transport system permease small subunit